MNEQLLCEKENIEQCTTSEYEFERVSEYEFERVSEYEFERETEQETDSERYRILNDELNELDINYTIILERNEEIRKISEDMEHLSDISLSLKELVYEQSEPLDYATQNIENSKNNIIEGTGQLESAHTLSHKFKGFLAKGAIVSTGVAGSGIVTTIVLNPIAGGIVLALGLTGLVICAVQMNIKTK